MSSVISLRPEMGEAILTHLGSMAKLPNFGVIAGQAVASAIEDLWGAGGGVYNDLDVFIPCTGKFTDKSPKANPTARRCEPQTTFSSYGGSVQRHLEMVQTYRIEEVRYAGLINRIYFRLPNALDRRDDDHAKRVVDGFDLNAVRVGIDLRTRKLVWDSHYEQFLANRELRIARCYTPAHSLIRLLKKAEELPNVTADIETAARITGMLQSEKLYRQLNSSHLVSYLFGDKLAKMAALHFSKWDSYYELGDEWFHQETETGSWRKGAGDETSVTAKLLRRMTPRGELDVADQDFARSLGVSSVVALPSQVYRHRDTRRKGFVSFLRLPVIDSEYSDSHLPHYAEVRGADYLKGVSSLELGDLQSFTRSGWGRFTMGWSGREQLDLQAGLLALETKLGVPDAKAILLDVAHDAVPFSLTRLEAEANNKLSAQRQLIHRYAVDLPDLSDCPVQGASLLRIRELDTERALLEFKATTNFPLYVNEGDWGYRLFVLERLDKPQCYGVAKVRLDVGTDLMTPNMNLVHVLNCHSSEGIEDLSIFARTMGWLKIWWSDQCQLVFGPNDKEDDIPV